MDPSFWDGRIKMLVHALDHVADAVAVSDGSGTFVFVNRAFCTMYGWSEAEVLGRRTGSLWPAASQREREALRDNGEREDIAREVSLAAKDGREIAIALHRSAVRDDSGALIATVRVMRDLTERDRIERDLRRANDALERSRAAFEELAMRDELTGLYNRRELGRRLQVETARALRSTLPFSFLLLDLDHFKSINDRYGHSAGDEVLRVVSRIIENELRVTDTAARYGGEEIAIILPETTAEDALLVAERLRVRLARQEFELGDALPVTVTASFGVATMTRAAAPSPELVFAAADEALYEAKATGRNRVVMRSNGRKAA